MKHRFLRLAVAILTFTVGWSVAPVVLEPARESNVPSVATPSAVPPVWSVLVSWENRDLKQIDGPEEAQLRMAIDTLRGATDNPFLEPRLFSRVSTSMSEQRYVLIEEQPLVYIPGESRLRVSVFDPEGQLLDSSEFGAGWRIMLFGIRFIQVKEAGEVLEVKSSPSINGADVSTQYYAVVGDKMRLIRLEDSKKRLVQNNYRSPNHTIGFTEIGRSMPDWQQALFTKDEAAVLATLTWLGGLHLKVDEPTPGHLHENLSEASLVEAVRELTAVKKAVNAMKDTPNAWVREAARLAAKEMRLSATSER